MRKSYVYKITCKITGEFYFGSSFNAKSDWYWGGGKRIRERVAQYGKENFVKEILEEFDDRVEAHKVENQYIEKFRNDEKCLNIACDHKFGTYSDETREKHSVSACGEKNPMYGKTLSDEHRAKISVSLKGLMSGENNPMHGKHHTEETRSKISAANRGKHRTEEHRSNISAALRGKHFSEEHKAKISNALRGKPHPHGKHWRKNPITGKREWYD